MKEYTLDGEKYYFNGKRWVDSSGLSVPSSMLGKLNLLLLKDIDLDSKNDSELLRIAANIKEGENYNLAIRAMEILVKRANTGIVRSVLPRLTSCYRKVGRPEDAIELAEGHLSNQTQYIASSALLTSLGAAYCDIEEYRRARECANRAYALSHGEVSGELHRLYGRINKYDEVYAAPSNKKY